MQSASPRARLQSDQTYAFPHVDMVSVWLMQQKHNDSSPPFIHIDSASERESLSLSCGVIISHQAAAHIKICKAAGNYIGL